MSHSIYTSEIRHLVAHGNYPMVEGGKDLFSCPGCKKRGGRRGKLFYNAGVPGQIVAYTFDPAVSPVPQTVDASNLATVTGDLFLGVLVDQDKDGVADDVRLIAGESIEKCDLDEINVGSPKCGNPAIKAASIDCVSCNETYVAKVSIDDNRTRSFAPPGVGTSAQEYIGTYHTKCCTCDDCPPEANCREVICGIVDSLNNTLDLEINGRLYPDYKPSNLPRPYRAVVGHKTIKTYCLCAEATECDCDTCNLLPAVTSATIGGETVEFTGNLTPDGANTALPMIHNIAYQIECELEAKFGANAGFAVVTESINDCCCPWRLTVVTCDAGFAIDGLVECPDGAWEFGDLVSKKKCVSVDPETGECLDPEDSIVTPECWYAVIASPEIPDCDNCTLQRPWTWHGIKLEVDFLADPTGCTPKIATKTIEESKAPRNFGSQIQYLEYKWGFPSGRGRDYSEVNNRSGWLGDFESQAKVKNAVTADCRKMYCSYFMDYSRTEKTKIDSALRCFPFHSGIHVAKGDADTIASFEEFLTALAEQGSNPSSCKIVAGVNCEVPDACAAK